MRHAIDLQVHESCMHVAVRGLHSCAFIVVVVGAITSLDSMMSIIISKSSNSNNVIHFNSSQMSSS